MRLRHTCTSLRAISNSVWPCRHGITEHHCNSNTERVDLSVIMKFYTNESTQTCLTDRCTGQNRRTVTQKCKEFTFCLGFDHKFVEIVVLQEK